LSKTFAGSSYHTERGGGPVRGAACAGSGAGSKHNLSNIHVKSLCPGDAGDGQNSGNRG